MLLRMVVAAALMAGVTTVFLREWVTQGPSMLAPQKDIRDNDDAEDIVTVGMTAVEVKDRITKPEPSWTMFMLKEWVEDDSIRIPISRPSDDPLVLTTVGAMCVKVHTTLGFSCRPIPELGSLHLSISKPGKTR